jgi:hypothetical protein
MFGLNDMEKTLLMYLYDRKDLPTNPPHQDLSTKRISESLTVKQTEIRDAMERLTKGLYANSFTYEGLRYCCIKPRGTREIEKETSTGSEFGIGTDGINYKRKKQEEK